METREVNPTGKILGPSNSPPYRKGNGIVAPTKSVAPTFEWVQHGDASARRRARAHVTRGFRREKAEAARLAKAKPGAEAVTKSLEVEPGASIVIEIDSAVVEDAVLENAHVVTSNAIVNRPPGRGSQSPTDCPQSLLHILGSGNTDPFVSLPVQLDAQGHAVIRHFLLGLKPVSYNRDSKSDFGPVKNLSFRIALRERAAFHTLCAVGANDMAVLQGRTESALSLHYRGHGISLVNKRLADGDTSDNALGGIALLAGYELMFGLPRNFMFHMQGITMLLQLRGGIENLLSTNPDLYFWIQWMDYSGSCNFISKRRFVASPSLLLTRTDLYGCLEELLQSLPKNYDAFQYAAKTCLHYENMVNIVRGDDTEVEKTRKIADFLDQVDKELMQSVFMTTVRGSKARRSFIEQFLHIICLMTGSVFIRMGSTADDQLFDRWDEVFVGEARNLLRLFADVFRMALIGHKLTDALLHHRVGLFMDVCGGWDWEEWQRMKNSMMDFFITEQVCRGALQILWNVRKASFK